MINFTLMKKQMMGSKPGTKDAVDEVGGREGERQMKIYLIFFIWEDATNVDMHFYIANLKVLCNSYSK